MAIKVVQWGSGNVGQMAMRAVLNRPDMELVGLVVTNPEKVGRDIGDILGIEPIGVAATNDLAQIEALDADVVLHMPLPSLVYGDDPDADVAAFVRLLGAGMHVVTTVGYMYPQVYGAELMTRLNDACTKGNTAFHGTGANPGWFGDLLPLLMSGLSLRIDQINVQEVSNFVRYPSPEIMFDMMNFGKAPDEFERVGGRQRRWIDGLFTEAVEMVAVGLGLDVREVTSDMQTWVAEHDLDTAAGVVAAGTVAGQRFNWQAMVGDAAVVTQETVWRMHSDAAPNWPHGDWSIDIVGDPNMTISLEHGWNHNVLGSTGAHAINAVPYLMEAGAGVKTFLDLPMIAGRGAHYPRT